MSALAYQDDTRALVAKLEKRESGRSGCAATARKRVASRLGALPGTLENLARGRLKRIDAYLRDRAVDLLIRETELEIRTLEHELALYRQMGVRPDAQAFSAVETDLAEHRATLKLWRGGV